MREVDDAHDAEDQREADAEEEQQRGLGESIDPLVEEEGERGHGAASREGGRADKDARSRDLAWRLRTAEGVAGRPCGDGPDALCQG